MPRYQVFIPLTFEAAVRVEAETKEEAQAKAIEWYRNATSQKRMANIGADMILDEDGNGATIGTPTAFEDD